MTDSLPNAQPPSQPQPQPQLTDGSAPAAHLVSGSGHEQSGSSVLDQNGPDRELAGSRTWVLEEVRGDQGHGSDAVPVWEPASDLLPIRTEGIGRNGTGSRVARVRLVALLVLGSVGAALIGGVVASSFTETGPERTVVFSPGGGIDVAGIVEAVEPSVVAISAAGVGVDGQGTGFIVDSDGLIATNAHVVAGAEVLSVRFRNGETAEARILATDHKADLALVEVDRDGLPAVTIGDPGRMHVGDPVVAIGNALGFDGAMSVTVGIVSAFNRSLDGDSLDLSGLIQTDAAINPGNSGGPLVNGRGEVVGVNTAIINPQYAQNVGFAIDISQAKKVIETLRRGTFLGVVTVPAGSPPAQEAGFDADRGAVVISVNKNSPAQAGGIEAGDVIVGFDGETVDEPVELTDLVRERKPGDKVTIRVVRDGAERTVQVELGRRPTF